MLRVKVLVFFLMILLGVCFYYLVEKGMRGEGGKQELVVYCAAGFRKPMTEIAKRYEDRFGVEVVLQFGGSGALASQLELVGGDLFFPADRSYLLPFQERGELEESFPVVKLTAGLVLAEGNPKEVFQLESLGQSGLKISLGDKSSSIGKLTWEVLGGLDAFYKIKKNVRVTKPTVNQLVEDVGAGAVDVAIAWDAVARGYPGVEWRGVSEFNQLVKLAEMGVLKKRAGGEVALHFVDFVTSLSGGGRVFQEMGFERVD